MIVLSDHIVFIFIIAWTVAYPEPPINSVFSFRVNKVDYRNGAFIARGLF